MLQAESLGARVPSNILSSSVSLRFDTVYDLQYNLHVCEVCIKRLQQADFACVHRLCSHSLMDKTIASGAVDSGSIPLGNTMDMLIVCAVVIAAAVLVLSILRSEWERRQLKTEYYRCGIHESLRAVTDAEVTLCKEEADAPKAERAYAVGNETSCGSDRCLRLAFISDVHDYLNDNERSAKLINALETAHPDLLLLGGDIVSVIKESNKPPVTGRQCELLTGLAGRYPVLYAEGNHEKRFRERFPELYKEYKDKLEAAGIVFLTDGKASCKDIDIYGVSLDWEYFKKRLSLSGKQYMPEKYLPSKLGYPDKRHFNILLIHSPMYLDEAAAWGAELVLSGHFHGGTIRLPDGRGLMTPQLQFFNRFCSGVHCVKNASMLVNRGLGTHTFNIRLNDLPELSVIDINNEDRHLHGRT